MPTAFYITPFSAETAGNEDPDVFETVQRSISEGALAAGVELKRADDIFRAGVIIEQVRAEIEGADVVIALCTGRNPNVMYELGLAEAVHHRPILVARSADDLPFDIHHWRSQMYGEPETTDDLAQRVELAIRETLEYLEAEPRLAMTLAAEPVLGNPRELVRVEDFVGFLEGLKAAVSEVGSMHEEIAQQRREERPAADILEELSAMRFQGTERILEWLAVAVEYRPEWLDRSLPIVANWFNRAPGGIRSGYVFWTSFHQPWVSICLKAAVGVALLTRSWPALGKVLAVPSAGDPEPSPLLINPRFTWADGYWGYADRALADFRAFLRQSGVAAQLVDQATVTIDQLTHGTDLTIGMARCVWENINIRDDERDPRRPYCYAAFANGYCDDIRWIARSMVTEDAVATALGAPDLDYLQTIAPGWYALLIQRTDQMRRTCDTWESAIS